MGTTPEAALTTRILKQLREHTGPDGFWWKVHGGPMQRAGIPDVCGVYRGQAVYLELKMPKGKPSKLQEHTMKLIRRAGGTSEVVYCWEDVRKIVDKLA